VFVHEEGVSIVEGSEKIKESEGVVIENGMRILISKNEM
jgi:hypothetical protein